jgi:hypothetical protein
MVLHALRSEGDGDLLSGVATAPSTNFLMTTIRDTDRRMARLPPVGTLTGGIPTHERDTCAPVRVVDF